MKIGYIKFFMERETIDDQIKQLKAFGCEKIVQEAPLDEDPDKELNNTIESLRKGDVLVIAQMDCLRKNAVETIQLIRSMSEKEADLVVMDLGLDTRTEVGKNTVNVLNNLLEMESSIFKEKQKQGFEAARKAGKHVGRPKEYTPERLKYAVEKYHSRKYTVAEIERITGVSRATLYRTLKKEEYKKA